MKLLDKLKSFIYEEDEEEVKEEKELKKEKQEKRVEKEEHHEEELVKKIDTEKSIRKPLQEDEEELLSFDEEIKKGPIMFDDDDFVIDTKEEIKSKVINEDRILYGGYTEKKEVVEKEKFKPSPVISPVYGILDKNYTAEAEVKEDKYKSLDHLFVEERKKTIDLDSVREKAFGETKEIKPALEKKEDEKDLLYDISTDDKPAVSNVTIGDAEEYFDDLGLEYNVDYKDEEKEKVTRSTKNKELADEIEEEIKEKEDIKQIEEVEEPEVDEIQIPKEDLDDMEEKNLYDLIDMMYDSKE